MSKIDRKRERQALAAAAKAEVWKARPGERDRPTPERIARGDYRLIDAEDAGVTYALDEASDELARMRKRGTISARQLEAARRYEELAHARKGPPSTRSCLNNEPVGFEGDFDPSPAELDSIKEWRLLCSLMKTPVLREVDRMCWEKPTDHNGSQIKCKGLAALRLGLDIAADFWRVE